MDGNLLTRCSIRWQPEPLWPHFKMLPTQWYNLYSYQLKLNMSNRKWQQQFLKTCTFSHFGNWLQNSKLLQEIIHFQKLWTSSKRTSECTELNLNLRDRESLNTCDERLSQRLASLHPIALAVLAIWHPLETNKW